MDSIGEFEYNKKDLIGHGAFAVVFKGRHKRKHELIVAIKCITKKNLAKSQSLLSKEIKILKELSDLHHENVVALLDCKETSHHVYLVMEYCNGGDLADYLQAKGTLSEDTIALFLRQIAGAMKALNAKGIVHRDLKPQNILLCHTGRLTSNPPPNEIKLKIADFGFARFLQDGVMAATLCGSPMYMAPEVIMSLQYDAKADLWSVGTIVYQCLTGKAPFQAQTPQQLKQFYEKHANLQPSIPSGTSQELRSLLLGLLKRNAKDRIEFDDLFKHAFLRSTSPTRTFTSSPVPVPHARPHSTTVASNSPTIKAISASPLSGNPATSPPHPAVQHVKETGHEPMEQGSTHETGGFLKVSKEETYGTPRANLSFTEDFVLVPENLPSDHSASSGGSSHRPPSSVDLNAIFSDNSPDSPKHKTRPSVVLPSGHGKKPESPTLPSPSRPSSLPVIHSPSNSPSSQPIPVPSQVKAFEQIQRSSPVSPIGRTPSPSSPRSYGPGQGVPIPRKNSAPTLPTIGSISPPTVQFTIGTPPSTTWRRNNSIGTPPAGGRHSTTPPSNSCSPLRRSGSASHGALPGTPPHRIASTPAVVGPNNALPTILGSPTKTPSGFEWPTTMDTSLQPLVHVPFGLLRNRTCPDNIAAIGFQAEGGPASELTESDLDRCMTEPGPLSKQANLGSRLSEQLLRAAFGTSSGLPAQLAQSPPPNMVVPYNSQGSPLHRESSSSSLRERAGSFDRTPYQRRNSVGFEMDSPPSSMPYCRSPPNMEGPVSFVAPELAEETLMDKEHNETVAKLNFVLVLVDCIIDLAQSRNTPITESVKQEETFTLDHISFISEGQRHMEQLVLYLRALQLLSSSIQLARQEIKNGRLQTSNSVKQILKEMNSHYRQCLSQCRRLHSQGLTLNPDINPHCAAITADKLIYNYAIEMCQTAALDELFGNPQECFKRYRNAQILLHSLAQQAQCDNDRILLNKYKESVEKRLFNLHSQGYIHAFDS